MRVLARPCRSTSEADNSSRRGGHSPTGALTPTDISVVGPMARYAEDIDLAMRVLAGPDYLQLPAWRVERIARLGGGCSNRLQALHEAPRGCAALLPAGPDAEKLEPAPNPAPSPRAPRRDITEINAFLDSLRLDKFRAVAEARKRIAARIKELQPKASNRQIAKTLGIGRSTVNRDTGPNGPPAASAPSKSKGLESAPGPNGPPPSLTGEAAARSASKAAGKEARGQETKERREASRAATTLADGMELRIGDCLEVLADVPADSVPLILTDPRPSATRTGD